MKNKGFTLVELLVVIAIIGILAAIVIVNVNKGRIASRDAKRRSDLATIKTAVEMYYDLNKTYNIKWKDGSGNQFCSGYNSVPVDATHTTGCRTGDDSTKGYFNNETPTGANYIHGISSGLVSWSFVNPAPRDPIEANAPGYNGYMYYSTGDKYSIYAKLEEPTNTHAETDTHTVGGVPVTFTFDYDGASASGTACHLLWPGGTSPTQTSGCQSNYRVGNGA